MTKLVTTKLMNPTCYK